MTSDDIPLHCTITRENCPPLIGKPNKSTQYKHFGNNNWWILEEWQTTIEPHTIFYPSFKQKITVIS